MKKIIFSILLLSVISTTKAQNGYDAVLTQIEENSTTLKVLREQMEAQKLGNHTGIFLSNPEVEFNYLWGNPTAIGNRTDFAIKQSFDFPTAYGHRNQISKLKNTNAELAYKTSRINLMLRAKQTCIKLVYYNALAKEYEVKQKNAEQIATVYKTKLEKGEANAIENNKAQMNLNAVNNEIAQIEIERMLLLSELKELNGGKEIDFTQSSYIFSKIPSNFDDWFAKVETKSSTLQYVKGEISISQEQVKLIRALNLPKFSAGYMSEKIVGQHFQGVSVGVSIPLWENRNRGKQVLAQMTANQSMLNDTKVQVYNSLQGLYLKASNLQKSATKYRTALSSFNNESLLKKALDMGEISLMTYLIEIEYYYVAVNNVLEVERDFELSLAELLAIEL